MGQPPVSVIGSGCVSTVLDSRSLALRGTILTIIEHARRGHVGSAFSLIELLRVLYEKIAYIDARRPHSELRDRIILSKGHGCLALYVLLQDRGFFPLEKLWKFCRFGSALGGHPQYGKIPGVEASSGSLGHGLSLGVGMALALRMRRQASQRLPRVYVIVGDGECDEGTIWEAALSASHHRLAHLCVLVDYNKMQSYGAIPDVMELEPFAQKWRSFGFTVSDVNGHDMSALCSALRSAQTVRDRPQAIICHTIKGKGISAIEQNPAWHHKSKFSDEDVRQLWKGLNAV